jgi:CubicO group peptidase (beta-lactamase class C family)
MTTRFFTVSSIERYLARPASASTHATLADVLGELMGLFFEKYFSRHALTLAALVLTAHVALAATIDAGLAKQIDAAAERELASHNVPSASVAVIQGGELVYQCAYGMARVEPPLPARPEMRYSIGSISKQFTAAAILLLAEQGKLSLDDPVSRFLPNLSRANEVTIRQLLSHTSGYQDYWPQDYVPPFMLKPASADDIMDRWARKPLDFDPGTQWQYSNTNFVIAGVIVEKASGTPFFKFIQQKLFAPLHMNSVMDIDQDRLGETDATGYMRYALGPPRVAPKEAKGWLFAAGELAMTSEDLAKWDIGLMNGSLLKPESYRQLVSQVCLKNGLCTTYGLGIGVREFAGHRMWTHGGEVSGFTAHNAVFPDDKAAVIVFINQDSGAASSTIGRAIASLLFNKQKQSPSLARDRQIFEALQHGRIDRAEFTDNANSYFTDQAIKDFSASLRPLGSPTSFSQTEQEERGGMTFHAYVVKFNGRTVNLWVRAMPDGKIEQYQVSAAE